MAVIEAIRKNDREFSRDEKGRSYTSVYLVKSDTINEDPHIIAQAVPAYGSAYVYPSGTVDWGSYCHSIRAKQQADAPDTTEVVCQFSPNNEQEQQNEGGEPTTIFEVQNTSYDSAGPYERRVYKDLDGKALKNPVGEPQEYYETYYHSIINVRMAYENYSHSSFVAKYNSVNDAPWTCDGETYGTGTAKFLKATAGEWQSIDIDGERRWYRMVSLTFEVAPEGWNPVKILNMGSVYRITGGESAGLHAPTDDLGNPTNQPVFLDDDGHRVSNPDQATYSNYRLSNSISFAFFGVS